MSVQDVNRFSGLFESPSSNDKGGDAVGFGIQGRKVAVVDKKELNPILAAIRIDKWKNNDFTYAENCCRDKFPQQVAYINVRVTELKTVGDWTDISLATIGLLTEPWENSPLQVVLMTKEERAQQTPEKLLGPLGGDRKLVSSIVERMQWKIAEQLDDEGLLPEDERIVTDSHKPMEDIEKGAEQLLGDAKKAFGNALAVDYCRCDAHFFNRNIENLPSHAFSLIDGG